MSTLTHLIRTAGRLATLPIAAVSFGTGLVKGAASHVAHAVAGGDVPEPQDAPGTAPGDPSPRVVPLERFPEAAPQREPAPTPDGFAHEPQAASPYDGSVRRPEAEVDDWDGDAEIARHPEEDPAADSVVAALARNDRPGEDPVDHAAIRATVTEAERTRGAPLA